MWSSDLYHGNSFPMDGQTCSLKMQNKTVQEEMVCTRSQLYMNLVILISFICLLVHLCIRSFIHSFVRSFVRSFICLFICSFFLSFYHSSVCSFIHSVIYHISHFFFAVIFLASFHSPEVVFEQLSVIYKIPR